jgi:hypothetical protein
MGAADYLGRYWYSSEPIFGVIMAICFTDVFLVSPSLAEKNIWKVIFAALLCCIAWGLVDGIFYAWEAHYELGKKKKLQAYVQASADIEKARELVADDLEDTLVDFLDDAAKEKIYQIIHKNVPEIDLGNVSLRDDIITILITFVLVVGSAIIVILPFLVFTPTMTALKISNLTGILLLFLIGYWREENKGTIKKMITGTFTAFFALIITILTIILGG